MSCGRKLGPYDCCSVVCGDCLELMKALPDRCIDAVITDPPFFAPASHYQSRISWGRCWGDLSILGQCFFDWCQEWKRVLKTKGNLLCFCNDESYPVFYPVAYGWWDFSVALVWDKMRVGLGRIFRHQFELILWASNSGAFSKGNGDLHSDILRYSATESSEREHPVQKPTELMQELVDVCVPGDGVVLDCFVGSGTTLQAAKHSSRHFLGFEISEEYCRIARERIALVEAQPSLFDRTEKMRQECLSYSGPDQDGALRGELDCLVEMQMLKERKE